MSAFNPLQVQKSSVQSQVGPTRCCQTKPLRESLLYLLLDGTFSDVTFIVGPSKMRIPCHQLILKARSPVFEVMFSGHASQDSVKEVTLADVNPTIFHVFLHYIYADTFVANESEALELLQVARMFDVQLLIDECEQLLESEASLDDSVDLFEDAQQHTVDNNGHGLNQTCRPSSVPVKLYSREFDNCRIRRKHKQLFERLQMCIFVEDVVGPSSRPAALRRSQPTKKKVVLSGMSLYCPMTTANANRRVTAPSTKEFKILVTARNNARKHYHDVSTLSTVNAEEGKVTDVEFDLAIPLESGKYFRFIVKETGATRVVGSEDYEVKNFGTIIKSVITPVGDSRVFVGCTTGTCALQRNDGYAYPQLIYKLRFKEC